MSLLLAMPVGTRQARMFPTFCLAAAVWVITACPATAAEGSAPADAAADSGPCSPQRSLELFQRHPDVALELVAAEPEVIDPVAMAFDEDGRLYVVEMRDYPHGPQENRGGKSRIRLLEDRDGDGRYETSSVFADQLLFPTGLQPWKRGLIVTLAGEVAYFRDTVGDGQADLRESWFTGFAEENPQLRANHPTFAYDNHVYIANGLRGGSVVSADPDWPGRSTPVSVRGMDFRFDPRGGVYESVSGNGQFGMTFDDFGHRFICSNRNPCMHVVLEDRYLKRNPNMAVGRVVHDVSPEGSTSQVFPLSRAWTTSNLHAGQFTAACGVTIYRGDLLEPFRGHGFVCEPTGNLVHRDVLEPDGVTFRATAGRAGVEFLATTDEWFRPVNLAHGPDGALYVVDMYRAVIEHPEWVPEELKNRPDNEFGNDRGRIYRVVPAGDAATRHTGRFVPLSRAESDELVRLLEHPNCWQRETAARLLYERQDVSVREVLEKVALSGNTAPARVQALWTLCGLDQLAPAVLDRALGDDDPRVRVHAIRLAEERFSSDKPLRNRVLTAAVASSDAEEAYQALLSAGDATDDRQAASLVSLLATDRAADPWIRSAVLTTAVSRPALLLERILTQVANTSRFGAPGIDALVGELCEVVGSGRDDGEIRQALTDFVKIGGLFRNKPPVERFLFVGLNGLGRGVERRGGRLIDTIQGMPDAEKSQIDRLFATALGWAESTERDAAQRLEAIQALGHTSQADVQQRLAHLSAVDADQSVRLASVSALSRSADAETAARLLDDFSAQSPSVRGSILDMLLMRPDRTARLLDAVEEERLRMSELDATRVGRLTGHRDETLRSRARRLLAAAIPEDRKQVLETYRAALSLRADPRQGRDVFRKNCTSCHRIDGHGVDVAPDIADSRTKTPSQLLESILDPNRAVDNNYFSYSVATAQGTLVAGIISAETATSVTLRQQENKVVTLLRDDILEIRSTGVSYMPVGLEKNISVQQMADLISYIKNWRYLDGQVPIDVGKTLGGSQ